MASDSPRQLNGHSGVVRIEDRLEDRILVSIPVGQPKADEAEELIKELYAVARRHYLKSNILSPYDVAQIFKSLGVTWEGKRLRIAEEKYSGKKQIRD